MSIKKNRHKAREIALQALYQWKLTGSALEVTRDKLSRPHAAGADNAVQENGNVDESYCNSIVNGAIEQASILDAELQPLLDRPLIELSPIEHAILLIAGYEMRYRHDIPYRVVINEAVELAKAYGGTEGYKYVNGVLDKYAAKVRQTEIAR